MHNLNKVRFYELLYFISKNFSNFKM